MSKSKYEVYLISKIMDSYIFEYNIQNEEELSQKFDRLCDMEVDALRHLAKIRKIKIKDIMEV